MKGTLVIALLCLTTLAYSQKIKTVQGDLAPLKTISAINVEFTYDHLSVGKFKNEEDYIAKKTEEYNKKEPGRGDKWAAAWKEDRTRAYEPKFLELFLKTSNLSNKKDAQYTLIFHTTFIEPGFNVGAWRKNAYIDATVTIVETANRNAIVAVLSVDNAPGRDVMGVDYDTSWRISEAYAKAGKSLAKYIW